MLCPGYVGGVAAMEIRFGPDFLVELAENIVLADFFLFHPHLDEAAGFTL
jgi:hypothetical protein